MSTKGNRDYRPTCHYAPPKGWINDPNGLAYEDGIWHLFAQHYPDEPVWGPMHWIHATSPDLLTWQDQGVALAPDEKLGMIFSGSGVIDHGNTSGLGQERDPMILMYTSHGEHEQQSIAYSDDRIHFTPYAGNPVIPNTTQKDFRDPKMIRNEKLNCWTVVIAAGDHAEFHASDDLVHWRKTGEFGAKENKLGGVFECPDLFPLTAPDGSIVWVLIASMALEEPFGGHRTQYFLGEFDGETFHETIPAQHARLLDSGYDNYAGVTFDNTHRRMLIGWAMAWAYARHTPTNGFCGIMTYARELSLIETATGLQLASKPVTPEFDLREIPAQTPPSPLPRRYVASTVGELPEDLFHVRVEADEAFTLALSNEDGEVLNVSISTEQKLVVDRTRAGKRDFSPIFDSGLFAVTTAQRTKRGKVTLDLYFDRMIAEVFVDGGTVCNSTVVFPEKPYSKATLWGKGKLWIGGVKE